MHDFAPNPGFDPAMPTSETCQRSEVITLHVVTKNLQSIRNNDRFIDFLAELDRFDFDLVCLSETWRSEREEILKHLDGTDYFFQVEVAIVALEFVCHTDC